MTASTLQVVPAPEHVLCAETNCTPESAIAAMLMNIIKRNATLLSMLIVYLAKSLKDLLARFSCDEIYRSVLVRPAAMRIATPIISRPKPDSMPKAAA